MRGNKISKRSTYHAITNYQRFGCEKFDCENCSPSSKSSHDMEDSLWFSSLRASKTNGNIFGRRSASTPALNYYACRRGLSQCNLRVAGLTAHTAVIVTT